MDATRFATRNAVLARALVLDRKARTPSVEELIRGLAAEKRLGARPNATLAGAVLAAAAALGLGYWTLDKLPISTRHVVLQPVASTAQPAPSGDGTSTAVPAFNPPPHSIAVLPFVNLSGDKEQEYFSDGLTEELLNSLSQINDLKVAARTSSFSFREHPDIVTVGHS
jgi:hypothetical protein